MTLEHEIHVNMYAMTLDLSIWSICETLFKNTAIGALIHPENGTINNTFRIKYVCVVSSNYISLHCPWLCEKLL